MRRNGEAKLVNIDGEEHSVSEWCRRFDISRATINTRVQSGMTHEEAFRLGKRRKTDKYIPLGLDGASKDKKYCIADLSRISGYPDYRIKEHIGKNNTINFLILAAEDAEKEFEKMYTYDGCTQSAEDWAKSLDISKDAFLERFRKNWPRKRTFTRKGPKKYEYFGKVRTLRELADIAGIPENTFTLRLRRGWTLERAMETEKHPWDIEYKNESHPLGTWAKILDIPVHILRGRKGMGWSIEKMFETPYVPNERKCGYIQYSFLGYEMTIYEWAERLEISYVTITMRLNSGCPVEEIFCTDLRRKHQVKEEKYRLKDWASMLNVPLSEITERYLNGMTIEEAILDIKEN